jgi:2-polyprenyl-3-methyl-5-hydroxy-6-metoxy-1,4-benzoquinol methylase
MSTQDAGYAEERLRAEGAWWKRLLDVQRPYRAHLRRLELGLVLEIGCGIGRNLEHLRGSSVGVDHNRRAVEIARARGLAAFTPEEFRVSQWAQAGRFDSLLFSHVLEHMSAVDATGLVQAHLHLLRAGGRVVVVTPQEAGFRSDPTHVEYMDFDKVEAVLREAGLEVERRYSFPLPRLAGAVFKYNEFVTIARKRAG